MRDKFNKRFEKSFGSGHIPRQNKFFRMKLDFFNRKTLFGYLFALERHRVEFMCAYSIKITLTCLSRDLVPKNFITEWFKWILNAVTHCIILSRVGHEALELGFEIVQSLIITNRHLSYRLNYINMIYHMQHMICGICWAKLKP